MAYKKTIWVNDQTPLNADNMNNIENGIAKNEEDILAFGSKGVANGVASLGADGKVPNEQLPIKYRHTVVLKLYGGVANPMAVVSFTDYSDSEMPITDYSKLHTVFGGKIISVNGLVSVYANSEWQTAAPCTLDLTGGTMATDKLNIIYAVTTNPIPKTLAELGASTFTVEDTVSPF